MKKTKTIGIAGLGWLGKPLAQHLMTRGYRIKGSVTSVKKAAKLQENGVDAYCVNITEEGVLGSVTGFLKDLDVLIIMIPPGLRRNTGANYVLKMTHFIAEILKSTVRNIIFISSTSVYSEKQAKVTERDFPNPTTEAGKQLVQVEQLFFNNPQCNTTIVRFGGLVGGSRQPAKYLAGREDLSGGNHPVNLIHRNDCIKIITEIIKQQAFVKIFNAVYPEHPLKKDYYKAKAESLNLEPPLFNEEDTTGGKQVDSVNLKLLLNFEFTTQP